MIHYLVANNPRYNRLKKCNIPPPGEDDSVIRFNKNTAFDLFERRTDVMVTRKGHKCFHGVENGKFCKPVRPKSIFMIAPHDKHTTPFILETKKLLSARHGCNVTLIDTTKVRSQVTWSTGYTMWDHIRKNHPDDTIYCVGFDSGNNFCHDMVQERERMKTHEKTFFW